MSGFARAIQRQVNDCCCPRSETPARRARSPRREAIRSRHVCEVVKQTGILTQLRTRVYVEVKLGSTIRAPVEREPPNEKDLVPHMGA